MRQARRLKHSWILIVITLILIVLVIIFNPSKIFHIEHFFSDYSAFYFFSALLQANAAIFAIVGIFCIFKIQSIELYINTIKQRLLELLQDDSFIQFERLDLNGKMKNLEKYKSELSKSGKYLLDERVNLEKKIQCLLFSVKSPLIVLIIGILINGIGLFLANYIHNLGTVFEFKILLIDLIIEIFLILVVISNILNILNYKLSKTTNQPDVKV